MKTKTTSLHFSPVEKCRPLYDGSELRILDMNAKKTETLAVTASLVARSRFQRLYHLSPDGKWLAYGA